MTLGTKQDYAQHRKCSKSYLSKKGIKEMLEQAMVVDPADGKKKIDFEKADALFSQSRDPARYMGKETSQPLRSETAIDGAPQTFAAPAPGSYESERTRSMRIKAEREELDLLERKKELIPVAATMLAINAAGAQIKEFLQSRNTRLSEQAATMTNPREIKAMLDEDDRTIFKAINDDFLRRIAPYISPEHQPAIN